MYPQGRMSYHFREMREDDYLTVKGPKAKRSCVKLDIYRKFSNALARTVIASVAWIGYEAFLKLKHETKVDHIFVLGNSGEQFEITLMALLHGLADNPYWCMEKNFNFCVELI
ncbi:uncharacterized protein LOC114257590 [Camellia sinensis]|uniref:uncharacterized protein LOC114257590 n=1 Tax=Camellia sinensis TaxID=4442 RepID=UPI001036CA33|nr:uncharacterized protein LOC114257590 [Camellia sinensis]XP_028053173.1 uncharacterized protein LOC114257590 [Camellia sinensis]